VLPSRLILFDLISLIFKNQSIYFDEPNPARGKGSSPEKLPDWVMGELGTSEHRLSESWNISSGEDNTLVMLPTEAHRYATKIRF
jgi:centrosomal protein CEP112